MVLSRVVKLDTKGLAELPAVPYGLRTSGVSLVQLETWIPVVRPYIQRVLDASSIGKLLRPENVVNKLLNGQMQLWVIHSELGVLEGIMITEIVDYPKASIVEVRFVCGTTDRLPNRTVEVYEDLQRFAASHGCKYIGWHGRVGWKSLLKGFLSKVFHQEDTRLMTEVDTNYALQ